MSLFSKKTIKPLRQQAEKILQEQYVEQQIIFDSVPAWIFYKDKENRFIRVNKAFSEVMQMSKEQLEGKSCFNIYPKEQAEAFWKDDKEVMASGKPKRNIVESMDSPKGTLWVRTDKIPYRDAQGDIIGIIGFTIDITESKKAEKSKQELAESLEEKVGERTKQLQEGTRRRQEELIKLDRTAKLLVRRDLELTEINNELNEKVRKLEDSEKSLAKAFNDLKRAGEKSEESKKALLNILEDVKEEKDKTLAIISNIYTPIIVVDKNNRITLFNSAAQKFLGLKSSDLGTAISNKDDFNLNNFKPVIRNKIILYKLKDNEPSNLKTEALRINYNNEELVYKVITSKVMGGNNEYLGVMKIFLDLTRETAIDKLKSEFVSIAAHQLRTPLSAIKWVIKMVLDGDAGKLNDEQLELLAKGYKSNERIIKLIDDLLDISRIEEGKFGYNFKYSDFQEVLNNVVENAASPIAKNHLKLSVDKPKKLPKIYMDPERITLVLQNLLDNAIKYTPEFGQIKIEIGALDKDKILKVSIKDQGVGIPKADQPQLFSKFFRGANAIRLETEGTGLGLFIAKNIIEKHNGEIGIKSEEGKGTEAYFSLPIANIIR